MSLHHGLLLHECDARITIRVPQALKDAIEQLYPSGRQRAYAIRAALMRMVQDGDLDLAPPLPMPTLPIKASGNVHPSVVIDKVPAPQLQPPLVKEHHKEEKEADEPKASVADEPKASVAEAQSTTEEQSTASSKVIPIFDLSGF